MATTTENGVCPHMQKFKAASFKVNKIMNTPPTVSEKSLEIIRATAPVVKENALKIATTVRD